MGNKIDQEDFIEEGFERLPIQLDQHPPRIRWENIYRSKGKTECADQLIYAQRVAESYHEAAQQIQRERDKLGHLCELKEKQIQSLDQGMRQNNDMLQQEITRMNAERQEWLAASTELRVRNRELEAGAAAEA